MPRRATDEDRPARKPGPPERGPPRPKKPRGPLDAVERELVMADIEFLKQKEVESGDRAKWEASQQLGLWRRRSSLD